MDRPRILLPCLFLCLGWAACGGPGGSGDVPGDAGADVPWLYWDAPAAPEAPGDGGPDAARRARLVVRVFRGVGQPLEGARVALDGREVATGPDGVARLEGVPAGRAVARVSAPGFAPAVAVAEIRDAEESVASVFLLDEGPRLPFRVSEGALLFREGVRVAIPPDAVVDASGAAVTGEVEAAVTPLDPTSARLVFAPGPFEGIPEGGGDPVLLDSVLMADITLWSGDRKLQLAPGTKATLGFSVPLNVRDRVKAGDRIPLWWFDPEAGRWRQEGDGVVAAGEGQDAPLVWTAGIGHFSWINCDDPLTARNCVVVTVVRDGDPVARQGVMVYPPSERGSPGVWAGFGAGTTDAAGQACVDFPLGQTVEAVVVSPQGAPVGDFGTVTGGEPWSSCEADRARCLRLELGLCSSDAQCDDQSPCTRDSCIDTGCRHEHFPWYGKRCATLDRHLEGTFTCDDRKCLADRPCGEHDMQYCQTPLVVDEPREGDDLILGHPLKVSGRAGCAASVLTVTMASSDGAVLLTLVPGEAVDGEFSASVRLPLESVVAHPGPWAVRVREAGLWGCTQEVVRTVVVPEAPVIVGGRFQVTALEKTAPDGNWFRVVYAYVPTGCPGAVQVAGAAQPARPRDLLGTGGMPAWNDIALVNGTPRGDGTAPTAYAKGRAGYESPVGNGPVPRACLAVDAATGYARFQVSAGRDPSTGASLFPGDSDVVCAGPLILKDGQDVVDAQVVAEGFDPVALRVDQPWARAAVCRVQDAGVVLLGARASSGATGTDVGFTLHELVEFLGALGCSDAMLLDGGAPVFFDADYPQYQAQEIPRLFDTLAGMAPPDCPGDR